MRLVGTAVGLALLVGAILLVVAQRELLVDAGRALRDPSWTLVALLLCCVLANIVLSGLMFSALIWRYGRVGLLEMQSLIAVASLLNFLPIRPGTFGRVAYHRAVNGIRTLDAVKTVVQGAAISAAVAMLLAGLTVICAAARWPLWPSVLAGGATVCLACAASFIAALRLDPRSESHSALRSEARRPLSCWSLAMLFRYLDVLVWSLRYWAAFAMLGQPIGWDGSVALACIGTIATMTPIGANGLGLREWAIGLAAPFVSDSTIELAISAELINRAAEILVVLLAGGSGSLHLARLRSRRARRVS